MRKRTLVFSLAMLLWGISALSGTSVAQTPVIGVDPTSLDFGDCITVGETGTLTIDLFNDINDPVSILTITDLQVTGSGFSLEIAPPTPFDLPGDGSSVMLTLGFTPPSTALQSGELTITSSNAINSPVSVALSGSGNTPPLCDAGGPYTGTAGEPIGFDGSGSSDPGGSVTSYVWDFGDGSTGSGATPTHSYASSGLYTVTLTVDDNCGVSSSCATTADVAAANQPPLCDAGGPYGAEPGADITFDGSGSSDP
ncbi:MAG: PKD domain-containing protein, partial [Candidatus Eiseniibacteriota bacterium]